MRMSEEERSVRVCFSLITTTALPIPALVSIICIITPRPVTGFYEQDVSVYRRKGSEALHVELASATGLSPPCLFCTGNHANPKCIMGHERHPLSYSDVRASMLKRFGSIPLKKDCGLLTLSCDFIPHN